MEGAGEGEHVLRVRVRACARLSLCLRAQLVYDAAWPFVLRASAEEPGGGGRSAERGLGLKCSHQRRCRGALPAPGNRQREGTGG